MKSDTGKLCQAFDETELDDFTNTYEGETFHQELGGGASLRILAMNESKHI